MQKFSELIKKSTEDGTRKKKRPAVQKGRFKIAKSDDDKMTCVWMGERINHSRVGN